MSSVLAFGLTKIGLALVLHPHFFSLDFVSNIFALGWQWWGWHYPLLLLIALKLVSPQLPNGKGTQI